MKKLSDAALSAFRFLPWLVKALHVILLYRMDTDKENHNTSMIDSNLSKIKEKLRFIQNNKDSNKKRPQPMVRFVSLKKIEVRTGILNSLRYIIHVFMILRINDISNDRSRCVPD